jgi:hypothetical protein
MGKRQGASIKKLGLVLGCTLCLQAQSPVPLGTAGTFGVLASSAVTNTGPSVINGNLGVSPGTAVSGFPPGSVTGTIYSAVGSLAGTAQGDLTTAYLNAQGRVCPVVNLPGDIGGRTLLPGVYCNSSTSLGITGTVTLDGNGDPNAVFIFQIGTTLTTASTNSVVNLINGAKASNVFWQVGSSATLGTSTIFNGIILAQISITLTTGAVFNGRALARTGAVTLDSNLMTNPDISTPPGSVPAPPSLILVVAGLAIATLYLKREQLLARFRRT